MRILVVQETDWLKKGPHQQHHLAEKLSLRGHQIRVIDFDILWRTRGNGGLYSRREVFSNVSKIYPDARVTVIRPGIVKISLLDYASLVLSHQREIGRQIKEFAPNVIIGFGILNSYLAAKTAKRSNIPFIYYWIDVLHTLIPFKLFQPLGKIISARTLKMSDAALVINEKLRDYVIGIGAPLERTSVLGASVDFKRFNMAVNGNPVREQYGIKENDVVLLFTGFFRGNIYKYSGLREVALELSKVNDPCFKFLIVGEGDTDSELQEIREKYGLKEGLILAGSKPYDQIPAFIGASDICLLPYHNVETMQSIVPIKMYDYMAIGKPVISTRLPGVMKEFGEDNGVVYVDRPGDIISKAMELVACGNLEQLGLKARSFVERYSWDSITDKFEDILERVVKEKRNGAAS